MPKAGFLTPKAIANRDKAKGLQKLRWYCQMCKKQCRDDNGFKCHTMSESHHRMMKLFSDNPERWMKGYSAQFEKSFMDCLRRHGESRVDANIVYQQMIAHKEHVHMNSTRWSSLSGFCKYLGQKGKAEVEETPKGLFIKFIQRDERILSQREVALRKERAKINADQRLDRRIQRQLEEAKREEEQHRAEPSELVEHKKKIVFGLGPTRRPAKRRRLSAVDEFLEKTERRPKKPALFVSEETQAPRKNRNAWLHVGLVVKVMNKTLKEGRYYRKKGVVDALHDDGLAANVTLLDFKDAIRIDHSELQTVIPALGRPVLVVKGDHAGHKAVLVSLDTANYCASLRLERDGKHLNGVKYEHFCKVTH